MRAERPGCPPGLSDVKRRPGRLARDEPDYLERRDDPSPPPGRGARTSTREVAPARERGEHLADRRGRRIVVTRWRAAAAAVRMAVCVRRAVVRAKEERCS
jgi:hypothetical protein